MVIGVTGTNGSGKGAVVDHLVTKGFTHYSVRDEIAAELKRRGLPVDRPNLGALGNELRSAHGAGYFVELFLDRARREGKTDIAIESFRSIGEVEALQKHGGILIAVDADRRLRYERIVARGGSTDKVDFPTWVAQEEAEWHNAGAGEMNIPAVMGMADVLLHNEGTLDALHAQVDRAIESFRK